MGAVAVFFIRGNFKTRSEIGGQRYVVRGNGRLQIAEDLGLADQLQFKKVELPFLGYRYEADVIEEALNIIYNRPRGIQ